MNQSTISITNCSSRQTSTLSIRGLIGKRQIQFAILALIAASDASVAKEKAHGAIFPSSNAPLYESVEDPPGQQARRILVEGKVLHFGQAHEQRESLLQSDLGFPMYFVRVNGGVRVQDQPIVFPSGSRKHFDLEDFSCSVLGTGTRKDVLCRSKSNGELYRSKIMSGGLVSFEMKCSNELKYVCHYELIGGRAIRPTKIQD